MCCWVPPWSENRYRYRVAQDGAPPSWCCLLFAAITDSCLARKALALSVSRLSVI